MARHSITAIKLDVPPESAEFPNRITQKFPNFFIHRSASNVEITFHRVARVIYDVVEPKLWKESW